MKKIGIISDTHAYWDEKYLTYFEPCDEIWHAGDIGSLEVAQKLAAFRPLRAVHGNIDGGDVRRMYPEILRWRCEEIEVLMKHIGGYPGKYDASIRGRSTPIHRSCLSVDTRISSRCNTIRHSVCCTSTQGLQDSLVGNRREH